MAATVIQAQFRAYAAARMMRLGPLSYLLRYIRKGGPNEVSAVAGAARLCSVVEWQSRGHPQCISLYNIRVCVINVAKNNMCYHCSAIAGQGALVPGGARQGALLRHRRG